MTWADQQRRMVALGLYNGRIDSIPGEGTEEAVSKALTLIERAQGVKAPQPVDLVTVVSGNFPLPSGFDPDYAWLGKIGTLPKLLQFAIPLFGTQERAGVLNNPVVMGWAKETGLEKTYVADSIAWCGLFAAVVTKRAGYDPVAGPLWALNWLNFGVRGQEPSLGDILCFVREGGGHVGFYVGEDEGHYHVLGGNQSDGVNVMRLSKGRLRGARRPAYKSPLPTWKPYQVSANGRVSVNEA